VGLQHLYGLLLRRAPFPSLSLFHNTLLGLELFRKLFQLRSLKEFPFCRVNLKGFPPFSRLEPPSFLSYSLARDKSIFPTLLPPIRAPRIQPSQVLMLFHGRFSELCRCAQGMDLNPPSRKSSFLQLGHSKSALPLIGQDSSIPLWTRKRQPSSRIFPPTSLKRRSSYNSFSSFPPFCRVSQEGLSSRSSFISSETTFFPNFRGSPMDWIPPARLAVC